MRWELHSGNNLQLFFCELEVFDDGKLCTEIYYIDDTNMLLLLLLPSVKQKPASLEVNIGQ